ncbi:hypothetical protein CHLRE_13g588368v5 [Chlamydomonas reinhardtii]|uniref:Uncharacterized protein n=1 Tax=Chlamydomonas reinhardtii TaxID=3055 RepID=A0A2K3D0X7_CHLRE|nr:uncharacterized protein CHLRE_13g588368v5 [Chlamydomonas reinhardtii]PNW74177.1 hypothetical protein CHLRE_13g588368v5 [Chlamydomonas reinhardtii]
MGRQSRSHRRSGAEPRAFVEARCKAAAVLLGPDGCCKCGTKAARYRHGMYGTCYEWECRRK